MKLQLTLIALFLGQLLSHAFGTIHVFVPLCDNVNQGIVKVPAKIGNGQDPANNLYWGCGYGVKSFFSKSTDWQVVKKWTKPAPHILERILFRHKATGTVLLADAYDGANIKECTIDFLNASAGDFICDIKTDSGVVLKFGGSASLLAYTGHDGLMDFSLDKLPMAQSKSKREVIILACYSRSYFSPAIRSAGAIPLVWSTHLMSPEAYTLKAAIDGWLKKETPEQIRTRAAQAYHQYQKCGEKAARNLLVTGF
ncbi:MAG TPA: hypothetical protein VK154_15510 [Chitinophagales bacterium]|nr:hypothetical protein [Chitinophagales bacterium]